MKTLLICLIATGVCFGQTKEIQKELSLEEEQVTSLEAQKTTIQERLLTISEAPATYVLDKISEIENARKQLPDRKPNTPTNRTMRQHLEWIRRGIEENPGDYVTKEILNLINEENRLTTEIKTLEERIENDDKKIIISK